jgi:hypothetical protein
MISLGPDVLIVASDSPLPSEIHCPRVVWAGVRSAYCAVSSAIISSASEQDLVHRIRSRDNGSGIGRSDI